MSKRLGARVALAIVALSAMTQLQGCGDEDDFVFSFVWAPAGSVAMPWFDTGFTGGSAAGTSQSTAGATVSAGTP